MHVMAPWWACHTRCILTSRHASLSASLARCRALLCPLPIPWLPLLWLWLLLCVWPRLCELLWLWLCVPSLADRGVRGEAGAWGVWAPPGGSSWEREGVGGEEVEEVDGWCVVDSSDE